MSRKTATLTATIDLIGRKESVYKVHKDLNLSGRNKINKRTGKPYTVFGEAEGNKHVAKTGPSGYKLTFTAVREKIVGNHQNDIAEHINRSIVRCNVDVTKVIRDVYRTED